MWDRRVLESGSGNASPAVNWRRLGIFTVFYTGAWLILWLVPPQPVNAMIRAGISFGIGLMIASHFTREPQ